jgi:hypothetical protein
MFVCFCKIRIDKINSEPTTPVTPSREAVKQSKRKAGTTQPSGLPRLWLGVTDTLAATIATIRCF